MANEIEIKLIADASRVKALQDIEFADVIERTQWQIQDLKNTYFDTQNFKLRELRVGLRIRNDGEKLIQTVKASGRAIGGLHERNESETELAKFEINLDAVEDPYLRILLEEAVTECGELEPVFITNFKRSKCLLKFADGSEVELALDTGNIYYEDESAPIAEVELELVKGDAHHLFNISRFLISNYSFSISNASKARRGYALCSSLPVNHRRMSVVELSSGMAAEKAFEIICYSGLKHWQYYEQFLNSSRAAESIQQMSRALVYMQHVYQLFGSLIPRHATSDLRANWSWVAEFVSSIIDVATERHHLTLMLEQNLATEQELQAALDRNNIDLKAAIKDFKALLSSDRYNLMMLGLSEWLFFKQWRPFLKSSEQDKLEVPIFEFAKAQLEHMLKELQQHLGPKQALNRDDYIEEISHLRKALNVGLCFGGLFDSKRRQDYRQPFIDLLAGAKELSYYAYVAQCWKTYQIRDESEVERWLEKREQGLVEAMNATRKVMFKSRPYWLF